MRRIMFFCALLLSFKAMKAQESKWSVSFSPAIVESPALHFGFQPGVEFSFNERLSLLTDVAFAFKSKNPAFSNSRYLRVKPELRYVLNKGTASVHYFTGLQLAYSYRKWDDLSGGSYFNKRMWADTAIGYSSATINSAILSASLQFGASITLSDHFSLDLYSGLGIRMIFTKYSNVENAVKDLYIRPSCIIFPSPTAAYVVNGRVQRLHANTGLRLAYRF